MQTEMEAGHCCRGDVEHIRSLSNRPSVHKPEPLPNVSQCASPPSTLRVCGPALFMPSGFRLSHHPVSLMWSSHQVDLFSSGSNSTSATLIEGWARMSTDYNLFYLARKETMDIPINNEYFHFSKVLLLLLFHNDVCTHPSHTWEAAHHTVDFTTKGDLTRLYLYSGSFFHHRHGNIRMIILNTIILIKKHNQQRLDILTLAN